MNPKENNSSETLLFFAWLFVIIFSSTGLAGRWADELYKRLFGTSPVLGSGIMHLVVQKTYHVFLFGVFGRILAFSMAITRRSLWRGVFWSFGIGALSEFVQFFFPNRDPSVADFLLNGISGSIVFWWVVRRLRSTSNMNLGQEGS